VRRVLLLAAAAAAAVAVPASAGTPRITVYAAASLTDVLPRIDARARYSFAGSDRLAIQIREGAPADVFASASPTYTQNLYRRGLVERPRTFAENRLVVIVPRSNPGHVRGVADLKRTGVKLVLGATSVPAGKYARRALARLGLSAALRNVVSEEQDVKGVVGKVVLGEADAGIVYVTDVRPVAGKVRTIAIPARGQPAVRYEIAVVAASGHVAAARAYVARVLGEVGRGHLAAAGFLLPRAGR
jgi:molybdate transport system substrate-binding protein